MDLLLFTLFRLGIAMFIPFFPLFGGFLSIVGDNLDWPLLQSRATFDSVFYQQWDKLLDIVYLSLELWVALWWVNKTAKRLSIFLFFYRLVGVVLFELTQIRAFLFLFPNIFESFFLFYLVYQQQQFIKLDLMKNKITVILLIGILLLPRLFEEYTLHVSNTPWLILVHGITQSLPLLAPFLVLGIVMVFIFWIFNFFWRNTFKLNS